MLYGAGVVGIIYKKTCQRVLKEDTERKEEIQGKKVLQVVETVVETRFLPVRSNHL